VQSGGTEEQRATARGCVERSGRVIEREMTDMFADIRE
jgi:hypothetical protein